MTDATALPPSTASPPPDPGAGAAAPSPVARALRALLAREDALSRGREPEGPGGREVLLRLHREAQEAGQDALAREVEVLLAERGLDAFPADAAAARDDVAAGREGYDVAHVPHDGVPRGGVVRVVRRGLRGPDGAVVAPARVEVSRGPRDPLEAALADLEDVLGRTPVPKGAPALEVGAVRRALARGEALDLPALARALASADALEDEVVDLTLKDVYRLLAVIGVEAVPPPGAPTLPPGLALDGVEVTDDPAPPGTVVEVRRRGFVRGPDEVLLAPRVVVSRGPRPGLLAALGALAAAEGPLGVLAGLAAEQTARIQAARDARALGRAPAGAGRDALVAAALELVAALERVRDALPAAERPGLDALVREHVVPALAGLDPDVEPLPPPGATALDDPALYEVEEAFDRAAPRGALLEVRRLGLVDRRGGVRRVHPARVVVSLGPKPPLEEALERIEALWVEVAREGGVGQGPAVDQVAAWCQALRAAARRVDDAQALGTAADPRPVALAAAELLDGVEPRAAQADAPGAALTGVLDGDLREGLRRLGVETITDPAALGARRAFSDRPAGEVLGLARRGLSVADEVVRAGEAVVSLGPRPLLMVAADAVEDAIAQTGLEGEVREQVAARVGLERAVEAELLAGRKPLGAGTPRERALALVDALDRARAAGPDARAALDPILEGALAAALEAEGLRLFPRRGEPLDPALVAREDAVVEALPRASTEPRGAVLEVLDHGVIEAAPPHEVRRGARLVLSLGVAEAFEAAVDEALAALREGGASGLVGRIEAVVARLRDPRAPVPEGEALDLLFEAHGAAPGAREALERTIAALGGEVFPRPGDAWRASDEGDVRRVFSDDAPAGQVLVVERPGLRARGQVRHRPAVEVSRGRPSAAQRALAETTELLSRPGASTDLNALRAVDEAAQRIDGLADAEQATLLVELVGRLEDAGRPAAAEPLMRVLRERGFRAFPEGDERWDDLVGRAGETAFEPPRKVLGDAPVGSVLGVERRAIVDPTGQVVRKGRVRVAAGPPSELSNLAEALRPGLAAALTGDALAAALEELDELLERIVSAHAERGYLLALPLVNLLHKYDLKEKLGGELKEYLRKQNVKELIAYPNYDANRLGPARLEEVRVKSDRPKGKIVRVLRPGFERTTDGAVLQRVRAEVSR